MKAAIFFATREGQTRKIADRIAADLRVHDIAVDIQDVSKLRTPIDWRPYTTVCIAASVHAGHHEREILDFVRIHRHELQRLSGVFVSVSLSQAGAQDGTASRLRREQAAADAQRMIDVFVEETGWRPTRSLPVAGALMYSRYNLFIRFVMKRIARKQGAPTDASHDYEFTDWAALDRFVADLVESSAVVPASSGPRPTASRAGRLP
jgi:menaquinone-dependent protoporphyrinogen oxidase